MTLSGFETVFYTLTFLVPGFLLYWAMSMIAPQASERPHSAFLRFLALSCFNYALWSWLIWLIFRSTFFVDHAIRSAFAWMGIILLSPIVLGILMGYFQQRDIIRRLFQSVGLNPVHGIATSWDYRFSRASTAVWVLVTLIDGSRIGGLFGSNSFASSSAAERDIYLQEIWEVVDDGPWQRPSRKTGIWIRGDQVKHIEFVNDGER